MTGLRSPRPWLALLVGLALALSPTFLAVAASAPPHSSAHSLATPGRAATSNRLSTAYGHLPMSFEANHGQAPSQVRFLAHGPGYTLFLTHTGAVFAFRKEPQQPGPSTIGSTGRLSTLARPLQQAAVRMDLVGARSHAHIAALRRLPGTVSYFIGKDPRKWHTAIPTYAQVDERNIYPGVDLSYQGIGGQLEYAFSLAPGRSPAAIRLRFSGVRGVSTDGQGDLVLRTAIGQVVEGKPVVYQMINGVRHLVSSRYVLRGRQIGFALGVHDLRHPVVIDPTILHALYYATYLGGSAGDYGLGIAVDGSGDAFVTGYSGSTNFPTTSGAYQTVLAVADDIVVSKLNSSGTALLYSTYFGGSSGEGGYAIAIDGSGDAFVTGQTLSTDFPTTTGAYQTSMPGDANPFVTEVSADGTSLVYSTYLGGGSFDQGNGIAVDSSGYAYVTGWTESSNFPHTTGTYQTTNHGGPDSRDAFITKLKLDGSGLVYSTYLGGGGNDSGNGIAVDSSGDAFVTGATSTCCVDSLVKFPTTTGAYQTTDGGNSYYDAFVTELNSTGKALVYSTLLGGNADDAASGIALDSSGDAFVTGTTESTDFPTTSGAYQTTSQFHVTDGVDYPDTYVTEVSSDGSSLVYSTFLGGTGRDYGDGIAVDSSGHAFVTGHTDFGGFPVTSGAYNSVCEDDAYLSELSADGSGLLYSTCIAEGIVNSAVAVDGSGNAYLTGAGDSKDFSPTSGAPQTTYGGGSYDAFVAKLGPGYQIQLGETGLPFTVSHKATFDGSSVSLTYSTVVPVGSSHTYSYPSPVADPTPGTRYVTTDPGGSITDTFSHSATYTTQHQISVSESGLPGGLIWHVTVNGTTYAAPLSALWLAHGTSLTMTADPLLTSGSTQYFFVGFTPGVPATLTAPLTTTAAYQTMSQILGGLNLQSSYTSQWNNVQGDIAAGKYADALDDIMAFVNHVTADSHVPPAQQKVLVLDAMLVYYNQICPALTAGQIGKTAASKDYAYYKSTVLSFGGTPLPQAC